MKQTLRRIFALLPLLAVLALGEQDALAQDVNYIERSWNETSKQVVETQNTCTNYKVLDSSTHTNDGDFGVGDNQEWDGGNYKWVVVKGHVVLDALLVQGEGHLILTDGAVLECTGGVILESPNKLYIYSQSNSAETQGRLIATQSVKGCAGIGGRKSREVNGNPVSMGTLEIHGGQIGATGAKYGAGIGGGEDRGIQSSSYVAIYGGIVWAQGGYYAAGIGGGYSGDQGGPIRIYGGEVHANGGYSAAGIGGGKSFKTGGGNSGEITIYGGNVQAFGGEYAAGIGGGDGGDCTANIVIGGGKVIARSGYYSAAIGGGYCGGLNSGVEINIEGGEVDALGRYSGPGIGVSTGSLNPVGQGTINISGKSVVKAKSETSGAGIGCGYGTNAPNVNIVGNCSVEATGSDCSAAIGAGKREANKNEDGVILSYTGGGAGSVNINTTGTVILRSNNHYPVGGESYNVLFSLRDDAVVYSGSESSPNKCTKSTRFNGINDFQKDNYYIRIEKCGHTNLEPGYYNKDESNHIRACKDCFTMLTEPHSYNSESHECVCGRKDPNHNPSEPNTYLKSVTLKRVTASNISGYNASTAYLMKEGSKFTLPNCEKVPGLVFMGWDETDPTGGAGNTNYMLKDGQTPSHQPGDIIGGTEGITEDKTLYARFVYACKDTVWTWSNDLSAANLKVTTGISRVTDGHNATVSTVSTVEATPAADGYVLYKATANVLYDERTYTFTSHATKTLPYNASIANDADNSATLTSLNSRNINLTLAGRTLYKDGHWNTLCLPFNVKIENSQLADDGVTAKMLNVKTSDLTDGVLTLNFDDIAATDVITAGTPFIIKWNNTGVNLTEPTFYGVVIDKNERAVEFGDCKFEGTFSPFNITDANLNEVIYLSDDNTLGYAAAPRMLHSCHAHIIAPANADGTRSMTRGIINYGDGTTDIISLRDGITEKVSSARDGWYDLQGRRLNGTPQRKGIYIHNGKETVIK